MSAPPPSALDGNQVLQHSFDDANGRLRVDATVSASVGTVLIEDGDGDQLEVNPDGSINTVLVGATDIDISHIDDSIKLGDGTSLITSTIVGPKVGLDVSIITNVIGTVVNIYNEITGIASAVETTIVTYTVPALKTSYILICDVAGTNISDYKLKINGSTIDRRYTNNGSSLVQQFDLRSNLESYPGYKVNAGDVVTITVIHSRPNVGNFNGRIQVLEV